MPCAGLHPQLPAPVLHVLLEDAFFPTSGAIAELRLEQVMAAQRLEARIDGPLTAAADAVHRRLHVVVQPASGHTAEGHERPGVSIEQHPVALGRIGDQPEHPTRCELDVRHLQSTT